MNWFLQMKPCWNCDLGWPTGWPSCWWRYMDDLFTGQETGGGGKVWGQTVPWYMLLLERPPPGLTSLMLVDHWSEAGPGWLDQRWVEYSWPVDHLPSCCSRLLFNMQIVEESNLEKLAYHYHWKGICDGGYPAFTANSIQPDTGYPTWYLFQSFWIIELWIF